MQHVCDAKHGKPHKLSFDLKEIVHAKLYIVYELSINDLEDFVIIYHHQKRTLIAYINCVIVTFK